MSSPPAQAHAKSRHPLISVIAIALGSFSVVVAEFVPVGALPQISAGLGVSEGTAGLLVTLPAITGAIAAPAATVLMRRLDRRLAIIGLTALIAVSLGLSAAAPNFTAMLLSRLLLGISIGGVWATSVSAAARLVPARIVHTASSIVFGAIAVGSVVSVPSSTLIATHLNWQTTFVGAAAVAVISVLVQIAAIPKIPAADRVTMADFRPLLRSLPANIILLVVFLSVFSQFSAYTFIVPYLQDVTSLSTGVASGLLLGYGALTIVGNFGGGSLLGRSVRGTAAATLVLSVVGFLALSLGGTVTAVVCVGLALWGLSWGNLPVAEQHWLYTFGRDKFSAEAVNATFTSVVQTAVAAGSLLSGVAVNSAGIRSSAILATVASGIGCLLALVFMAVTARRFAEQEPGVAAVPEEMRIPAVD
ncbi:MFS transporter [Streptomyces sp. SCL15-6]|uniref:MFS transporter n=1 Tax=Streptomyces sp. SCL15-6 TaxID=2967222 RepID=UPI0029666681|nr:MFS transporter [Streptomyces sp. SCL15-6]